MKTIFALLGLLLVATVAFAASGDSTQSYFARYTTAKTSACTKGSIAYSRTRVFICTSTAVWKKATLN